MNTPGAGRVGRRAEWVYALALFGAHMAFLPLLVLLLPRRIQMLAGADATSMLSWALLAGGVAASLAHIIAGHWSDRWLVRFGSRRGLIAVGLVSLLFSYLGMALATNFAALLASFVFFQCSLNLAFAPLGALIADYIPDPSKGRMAGLMNTALPLSSLVITAIAWTYPADSDAAFLVVGLCILVTIAPLLLIWDFKHAELIGAGPGVGGAAKTMSDRPLEALPDGKPRTHDRNGSRISSSNRDFMLVWLARLMVQLGATFLLGYLFVYVSNQAESSSGWPDASPSALVGQLSALVAAVAIIAAIASGYFSDAIAKRRLPMAVFALCAALALLVLATEPVWLVFVFAYGLFHLGLTGFLAVDTALVAQLLAGNPRRGMFLGLMNLTNTLPAIIVPAIALATMWQSQMIDSLSLVFLICAAGSVFAAVAVMLVRNIE